MNHKLIIGLLGEKGGGKGTFTSVLKESLPDKTIESYRSRDILSDILNILNLPLTRDNFQTLAPLLRDNFRSDIITQAIAKKISQSEADIVIFDGVRWNSDVELIRTFPNNYLVYVTADPKIRYQRTKLRKEKAGEDQATFEQFLEEETAETERYIPIIGATADFKIINNGSLDEFKNQVSQILTKINE